MSTSKLSELTNDELDTLVAMKVMRLYITGPRTWRDSNDNDREYLDWHPSTDRNAAALVLERIGELGLGKRLAHLVGWMNAVNYAESYSEIGWAFLTYTPRQLCEAAIECMEKKGK